MTQPDYMPYRSADVSAPDLSSLKVLSVLHYVWGGLTILLSCLAIIYIVLGVMMLSGTPVMRNAFPTTGPATYQGPPPEMLGYLFAGMGSCGLLFGWTYGILTIIAGRRIDQRRSRVFSLVMAGISCISFPFGTALGVFTIIVLSRDSVKALYAARQAGTLAR